MAGIVERMEWRPEDLIWPADESSVLKPLPRDLRKAIANIFCPTGPGGGVDPSCSPGGKGQGPVQQPTDLFAKAPKGWAEAVARGDNPLPQASGEYLDRLHSTSTAEPEPSLHHVPIGEMVSQQADLIEEPVVREYAAYGQIPPVAVTKFEGKYLIDDGNHRVLAAALLGHKSIQAFVSDLDALVGNYRPDQPRDPKGRFAHTGGGRVALPIGISKGQRSQLTPEERAQWNKTWHEHDKAKKAAKAEKDPAKALHHTLREVALLAKLKDIRAAADARFKGGGTAEKKHGDGEKKGNQGQKGWQKQEEEIRLDRKFKELDHAAEAQKMVSALEKLAGPGRREDLIHLQFLRKEMSHLSKTDFDAVMEHARRAGQISLSGAEGRFGLQASDKKAAIHEKDPVTGLDSMLLYASLRGGARGAEAGGGAGVLTKTESVKVSHADSEIKISSKFGEIKKQAASDPKTAKENAKEFLDDVERMKGASFLRGLALDHGVQLGVNPGGKGLDSASTTEIKRRLLEKVFGDVAGAKPGLTRQEVTDRIRAAGAKAATDPSTFHMQDEALRIMGEHGREVGDVMKHGMTNAEKMHELEIEGIKFQWPGNHPDAQRNAAQSIADLMSEASGAVPDKLWNANKSVVFSTQRNKDDDYWAQEYGIPGFRAGATGGDGHVVAYNTERWAMTYNTFAHEAGHNLAKQEWGQTSPPAHTDYGKAQKIEKPVSKYGSKSPAEDFAEASKQYSNIFTRTKFKNSFPLKYAALRNLLGEPPEPTS
jgi:hypothetical protein